ncbi:hypothetical protein RRG08_016120 [Elysia crispata]|uniref:Uncharacterized protein n=1 Tax=Elysia crispata TaxID=231223 RepID=A0AAE1DJ69_9GAST|nr:hypothetical protein RRG08_016120 [Elysia crispata]
MHRDIDSLIRSGDMHGDIVRLIRSGDMHRDIDSLIRSGDMHRGIDSLIRSGDMHRGTLTGLPELVVEDSNCRTLFSLTCQVPRLTSASVRDARRNHSSRKPADNEDPSLV